MRIVVTGTSGAGKSTLARRIARHFALPHIELDAINWQPGWHALSLHDVPLFASRVAGAVAQESWVLDGNYGMVRDIVWPRATHLVWLDYPRAVIMRRVIARSLHRTVTRAELWPGTGNRESLRTWLDPMHPVRWAWTTCERRRRETAERLGEPRFAHLRVLRLAHPRDVACVTEWLRGAATP